MAKIGYYDSPVGMIQIEMEVNRVCALRFVTKAGRSDVSPFLTTCLRQLRDYFSGKKRSLELPLSLAGTDFQKKVWRQLRKIPHGQTVSYADVARAIGHPKAVRAVGNANGKNRIPIIIPCHRVIASDGKLGGYSSGLARKRWLLRHEKDR